MTAHANTHARTHARARTLWGNFVWYLCMQRIYLLRRYVQVTNIHTYFGLPVLTYYAV
jgi:hypothetical protein